MRIIESKRGKAILKISLLLNVLLVMGILFLGYKAGLVTRVAKAVSPNTTVDPNKNPQFIMRKSLFENLEPSATDVVFVGDSITERSEWSELFPNVSIKNRGIGSDTTFGVKDRLEEVIKLKPKKVFLMMGINDLQQNVKTDEILKNYETIVISLKQKLPNAEIYVQSTLPVNNQLFKLDNKKVQELDSKLQLFSSKNKLVYVDLYNKLADKNGDLKSSYTADGIHLKGEAYQIWASQINKYIY